MNVEELFSLMDLIHQGRYQLAVDQADLQYKSFIQSRSSELQGRFTDALSYADNWQLQSTIKLKELNKIALVYAYWRLDQHDKGLELIRTISPLLNLLF